MQQKGILIKRYKRFLADIKLSDGKTLTVHCPNSGSMRGCSNPGSEVIISRSDNPKRKYAWTLEMVMENGVWIGVNTSLTNKLVAEALQNGTIDDFGPVKTIRPEIKVSEKSRLDFLVETESGKAYIEVKNCSLAVDGVAMFPDAVTLRGKKHLEELASLQNDDVQTAVLFCVQRADADTFSPAAEIDPDYARTLAKVHAQGVGILVYQASVHPKEIIIDKKLPCSLP